jgi:hypothetical protein
LPLVLDVLFLLPELLNEELPFVFLLGPPLLDGLESPLPVPELLNEELPFVFLLGPPLLDGLESPLPAEFLLEFLVSILSSLLFLAPLCLENFERDLLLAPLLGPLLLEKLLLGFNSKL